MNSQFSIFAHTLFINSLVLLPSEAAALGEPANRTESTFLSFTLLTRVSHLALPPVGWHRTVEHPAQTTTVWAWLKTVVILRRGFLISGLIITKNQLLMLHGIHLIKNGRSMGLGCRFYHVKEFEFTIFAVN